MFLLALCIAALLGAMLLSALVTWCVRDIARKKRWLKGPDSERHVHSRPIPRLGGIAVYLTFIAGIVLEMVIVSMGLHMHQPGSTRLLLQILMPATLMFVTGLADDFFNLRPILKLAMQVVSGYWLFHLGCRVALGTFSVHGVNLSPALSCAATVIWVVMLCNAFNLIDGLDGLAAGSSVFPLLTLSAVALIQHNGQRGVAGIILTGALIGFLRFNFNPATIFLGDNGSLFLGFMLSALSLSGDQTKAPTLLSVALPVVACGFPLAETFVSVVRRFLSGRPIFSADREHFHHRLLKLGFTHRQVVILLFGVSGIFSLMSVILLFPKFEAVLLVGAVLSLLVFVGVGKLGYPEFAELGRLIARLREQKMVIAQNVRLRKLAVSVEHAKSWEEVSQVLRSGFQGTDFKVFELTVRERGSFHKAKDATVYSRKVTLHREQRGEMWSLTLDFANESQVGYLELSSAYKDSGLLIDVNILLQVLRPALATASDRLSLEQRIVAMPEAARASSRSASALG